MNLSTIKPKHSLLSFLTAAILIPTLASLLLAWWAFRQFQRSIDYLAVSYVRNMGQVVARRIATPQDEISFYRHGLRDLAETEKEISIRNGSSPLSVLEIPGIYAVLDEESNILFCNRGRKYLGALNKAKLEIGHPANAFFANGRFYTFVVYRARQGRFLLVAIDHKELIGKLWNYSYLWPFLMGLNAVLSLCFLFLMWSMVIKPLRKLYEDVADLRADGLAKGQKFPQKSPNFAVEEIHKLRNTIAALVRATVQNIKRNENYLHDIIKVQEQERASFAREIHDGPLQDVTALIQRLRLIAISKTQQEASEKLAQAETVAMGAIREMRGLCDTLTPPWLELGLRRALIELTDRLNKQYSAKIRLAEIDDPALSSDQTLAFFRIAQQALANAQQHGEAKNITIRLLDKDDCVRMEIEDDGKGFVVPENLKQIRASGHRGLSNMQERMQLIGGSCEIVSAPGKGTTIICTVKK